MRRITPRDIALYLILFAVVFYSVSYLQRADWEDGPDYSQIRTYFTQERVEYFTSLSSPISTASLLSVSRCTILERVLVRKPSRRPSKWR